GGDGPDGPAPSRRGPAAGGRPALGQQPALSPGEGGLPRPSPAPRDPPRGPRRPARPPRCGRLAPPPADGPIPFAGCARALRPRLDRAGRGRVAPVRAPRRAAPEAPCPAHHPGGSVPMSPGATALATHRAIGPWRLAAEGALVHPRARLAVVSD